VQSSNLTRKVRAESVKVREHAALAPADACIFELETSPRINADVRGP